MPRTAVAWFAGLALLAMVLAPRDLFHASSNAFIGLGPYVSHDVLEHIHEHPGAPEILSTSAGAYLIIGAWL